MKIAPLAFLALEPYPAAMSGDYLPGYIQANTHTAVIVGCFSECSVEPLEDVLLLFFWDAYSLVPDRNHCLSVLNL